jgi:hypothetical protein
VRLATSGGQLDTGWGIAKERWDAEEGRVGSLAVADGRRGEETVGHGEKTMWTKIGRLICWANMNR